MAAASAAVKQIKPHQVIGLGAGATIAHLVTLIANNHILSDTLVLASPSLTTLKLIAQHNLKVASLQELGKIDIYFDGCDQFDNSLNALKSMGGIHTDEKIFASAADTFILLGDDSKYVSVLGTDVPLSIEVLPEAGLLLSGKIEKLFDCKRIIMRTEENGNLKHTVRGNLLMDVYFNTITDLESINLIKLLPGVVDHSLFYNMAKGAIVAGSFGSKFISL